MKEKFIIKTSYNILPIFGLVLLLLLSPCKVRNFIQTELGTPKTEVANKSQTKLNASNCSDSEITKSTLAKAHINFQFVPSNLTNFKYDVETSYYSDNYTQNYKIENYSGSPVPLYILYQNFKDYL